MGLVNDKIIELIQARLKKGHEEYNRDVPIRRERNLSNIDEAVDEVLDLTVYLTAYTLELQADREEKQSKTAKVEVNDLMYIFKGLHAIHEESWRENAQATANEIHDLIIRMKKSCNWTHEDDKRIGQTDNPINKVMDHSPHDPGDENDSPLSAPTKCIPGSNCD
tara:strand:- start:661 stop:1155 length:495 start_codon:yes stop_codon:yes gene_type:complete